MTIMKRIFLNVSYYLLVTIISLFAHLTALAQVLTPEDSLYAGLIAKDQATVLSGYGEARYTYNIQHKNAEASLSRAVLFIGHKFSKKISLFTELELENALVSGQGGDEGANGSKGGIGFEQVFLKFNLNPTTYLVAGLFLPRLGIINENHLPTTFNGVDRPFTEQFVIPSTWREVGIGLYGVVNGLTGLNYNIALTNGLNSSQFTNGSGIRGGRQLGSATTGSGLGASGALLYYINNFRIQASGYIGGSTGVEKRVADSLQLNSGVFGNPVILGEMDAQYINNGWNIKVLGATVNIANAANINLAYANNTPKSIYGAYAEVAYDFLYHRFKGNRSLAAFGRFESLDLNAKIPANGIQNDANRQQYIVAGFTYKPLRGVAIKVDYVERITGEPNPALIVTPFPQQIPYFTKNGFANIGIGYSF